MPALDVPALRTAGVAVEDGGPLPAVDADGQPWLVSAVAGEGAGAVRPVTLDGVPAVGLPDPGGIGLEAWAEGEGWSPEGALGVAQAILGAAVGGPVRARMVPEAWRVVDGRPVAVAFEAAGEGEARWAPLAYLVLARRRFGRAAQTRKVYEHHVDRRMAAGELAAWGERRAAVEAWLRAALAWDPAARPSVADAQEALARLGPVTAPPAAPAEAKAAEVAAAEVAAPSAEVAAPSAELPAGAEPSTEEAAAGEEPGAARPAAAAPVVPEDAPTTAISTAELIARLAAPPAPPRLAAPPPVPAAGAPSLPPVTLDPHDVPEPAALRSEPPPSGPSAPRRVIRGAKRPASPPVEVPVPDWVRFSPGRGGPEPTRRPPAEEAPADGAPPPLVSLPKASFAEALEVTEPPPALFDEAPPSDEVPGRRRGGLVPRAGEVIPFPAGALPPHEAPRTVAVPPARAGGEPEPSAVRRPRGWMVAAAAVALTMAVGLAWVASRPASGPAPAAPARGMGPSAVAPPVDEAEPAAEPTPAAPPATEAPPADASPTDPPAADPAAAASGAADAAAAPPSAPAGTAAPAAAGPAAPAATPAPPPAARPAPPADADPWSAAPAAPPAAPAPPAADPWAVPAAPAAAPAATPAADPWSAPAPVLVTFASKPDGIVVTVDGEARGRTPVRVYLTPGTHVVQFVDEDGLHTQSIDVKTGGRTQWTYDASGNRMQ